MHGIAKGITFAMCFSWYRFKVNWIGLSGDKSIFFALIFFGNIYHACNSRIIANFALSAIPCRSPGEGFQGFEGICSVMEQDIIDAFTERLILGYQNFATSNISVRNGAAVDALWCVILSRTRPWLLIVRYVRALLHKAWASTLLVLQR